MTNYLDLPSLKDVSYRDFLKDMDLDHESLRFITFSKFFRTEIKYPGFVAEWSMSDGHNSLFFYYGEDLENYDVIYYWLKHKEEGIHILKLVCGDDCDGQCNNRLYMSELPKKVLIEARASVDDDDFYNLKIDEGHRAMICSKEYALQIDDWLRNNFKSIQISTDYEAS